MRCSNCSQTVRPVVALDIDGTLGDYHGHFIRFVAEYIGGKRPTAAVLYNGAVPFKTWAMDYWNISEATWYDAKLAYRQGGMKRSMPVYPGAVRLVNEVRKAGAELWLTTTRPYLRLDNIDPDTREWLSRNGMSYDFLMYDDNKYSVLEERVEKERVVAILDDLPELIEEARETYGVDVPILRAIHYNKASWMESMTLPAATKLITERIGEWREAHE